MAKKEQKPKTERQPAEKLETTGEGVVYTYIGRGATPPRRINFMGKQQFTRFKAVEVTDPDVLKKLENHACFYQGELTEEQREELDIADEEAAEAEEANIAEAAAVTEAFFKKHGPGPKDAK